jgi:transposase-like protein
MDARLRFVARLLEGEAMTDVCREFGVSRKTGYKIFDRYKEHGLEAMTSRPIFASRQPRNLPPRDRLQISDRGEGKGLGPGQLGNVIPSQSGCAARIAGAKRVLVRKA